MKYNLTAPPSSTSQNLAFEIPDLPATITPVITGTTPIDPVPPPVNIAPTANAGTDITIQLPTNSIVLNGSGNDPDGTIKTIQWTKISGGSATIVNPNSLVTQVTGLAQGNYSFQIALTDNQGATGTDSVNVTVQPAVVTGNTGTATGISTFESIGLYWSGHGQSSTTPCKVQFRKVGDTVWSNGFDLSYDSRAIGGRPAAEYRGSLVYLTQGTQYEILLQAGSVKNNFTVSTWNEVFPENPTVTTLNSATTITQGGTATAYKVYTGIINGGTNNIVVNASYVILRGFTLTGAGEDAILLGKGVHDVVIEKNDISKWGFVGMGSNNQAAVRCKQGSSPFRIIIQDNFIHDSNDPGSGWDAQSTHPLGPNGINLEYPGTNNVIRYNKIASNDPSRRMMDGIGGADNFTTTGFPGADSDVYCNYVDGVWDDGLELEGGGCNVRAWSNFTNNSFTGIACATCAIGPLYIFNNVSNVGQRLHGVSNGTIDTEDRGPFNKCGSQDSSVRGGKVYLFHNTVLQPKQSGFNNPRGLDGGVIDSGGATANIFDRNNIWQTAYSGQGGKPINLFQSGSGNNCDFDYDLMNQSVSVGAGKLGSHCITGTPTYNSSLPLTLDPNGYFLATGSNGKGKAVRLNNFNDSDTNDMGAYNLKQLKFGVRS